MGLGLGRIGNRIWIAAALGAAVVASPALALDPQRSLAQYKHTRWTVEDGAPASIEAIAQTPDGFLWLGTVLGLYRFDGVTFEAMHPPQPAWGMSDRVVSLMTTRSGALWVGYENGGIAVWENGRFHLLYDPKIFRAVVDRMVEARDGTVWVATSNPKAPLVRYVHGAWTVVGPELGLPNKEPSDLLLAKDGALWAGFDGAAAVLAPGSKAFRMVRTDLGEGVGLAQDGAGWIWASDAKGTRVIDGPPASQPLYSLARGSRVTRIIVDRDQTVWGVKHPDGVFRIRPSQASGLPVEETASEAQGLSSAMAYSVFEDHEGDIWVATVGGLDRYRAASVVPEAAVPPASPYGYLTYADPKGVVYVTDSTTLYRARPNEPLTPIVRGLDHPSMLCGAPGGGLWLGLDGRRIVRVDDGKTVPVPIPAFDGAWFASCAQDGRGDMWVAGYMAGLLRYDGKTWTQFKPPAMGSAVTAIATDSQGRIVADGGRGAVRWDGADFKVLATPPRPLRGGTMPMANGPLGVLSGSDRGLTRFVGDGAQFISRERFPFLGLSHGLVQTPETTWLWGAAGLARMRTADLKRAFEDPKASLPVRIFDLQDGLPGPASFKYRTDLAVGGDGRVWIATTAGVASFDPRRAPVNRVPPPVVIKALVVDGHRIEAPKTLALPKGARSLQIDYTALSLSMPERVRFRYRLEGVDADWVEAGGRRQAFYTNLKPGRYVFRVKAANPDGVWNEDGARLTLDLPPTFLQSRLFLALCVLAAIGVATAAYRLRVARITQRLQAALRERTAERERIARELHDTLLQGVQGLILKFQSASRQVPKELPAREALEQALDRAEDVVVEARDRVRSLRTDAAGDLAATLAEVAERMRDDSAAEVVVRVEGTPRALHPVVADEIERIAVEALFNAHRHAGAQRIVVEVAYDPRRLGVRVRDDGVGIDQAVLDAGGREGHFGLAGMRERANKISATLTVRSRPGQGCEIELVVPASVAYTTRSRRPWAMFWRREARMEATA